MQRKITIIVASLVLLVSLVFIWRTLWPSSDKFDLETFTGVGQALAEETAKALSGRGRVVAVIAESTQAPNHPSHVEWEAFRIALTKSPAINLLPPEIIPTDTSEVLNGCSSAEFARILERHSQVDGIVFLMRLPPWPWLQTMISVPQSITAKVIVMGGPTMSPKSDYTGYFSSGILSALIIGRLENSADQIIAPKSPLEKFDNEYQIFTRENYESLPE